jgi:hypothetical protein
MSHSDDLSINLADPDDIRTKLPRVRNLHATKRRDLEKLTEEVRHWGELAETLARLVGETSGSSTRMKESPLRKSAPGQDRAVEALEKAGRPMGPTALYRFMLGEGLEAPKNANALGANLWAAARAGRVKKTPDDLYAPLSWEPSTEPVDAAFDGGKARPMSGFAGVHPNIAAGEEPPNIP